ncbi:MAG: hypothetical protein R3F29_12380 [Planctomycetota bacterium]
MASTSTRSIDLGKLIGTTFSTWFRNLVPFTFLSLVVLSPMAATDYWVSTLPEDDYGMRPIGPQFLSLILPMVLTNVLSGALTFGIVQQLRKQPAGFGASLAQGLRALPAVIGTALLVWLRVALFTLLLVIPGMIEMFRLYVAIPAAVMERGGVARAIERSITLTDGSRWQLFAAWLVTTMAAAVPMWFVVFFYVLSTGVQEAPPWWINTAVQIVVGPLTATMGATAYFLLRMQKEHIDADQIAKVFE